MKEELFRGVCTALVTPFHHFGINYDMLNILIERQNAANIPAMYETSNA